MNSIVATKTEDSIDSFPWVCATETGDSSDSYSLSTANDEVRVCVNVYDLNPVNMFFSPFGVGLYHSGVEIDGLEYSFASKAGGIFKIEPRKAKGVRFCEQIQMGVLEHGEEGGELQDALEMLRSKFQPQDYDLVTRNCNHFCDALIVQLLGKQLPGHVNRMASIWATGNIAWLVPQKLRRRAPVCDKNLRAYGGVVPFLASMLEISTVVMSEWIDVGNSVADIVSTSKGLSILLEDQV